MRVCVHDFVGHPFQVQLSRNLALRGHEVLHVYSRSMLTPQASLEPSPDDAPSFAVSGLSLSAPMKKYSPLARRRQDIEHGGMTVEEIRKFRPEAVLSANTPLDAQTLLQKHCRASEIRFIYWLQDLLGVGIYRVFRKKLPGLGHAIGRYYMGRERRLLRRSHAVVAITEDFNEILRGYGVDESRIHVIENWAPLDELTPGPRHNPWAEERGLQSTFNFLYSGTMGMKHNPELMLRLAKRYRDVPEVRVVVISEGLGATWLAEKKAELGLDNLVLFGFQPFEVLPQALASADVLVAVLEPDAGVFSVPSKVLSYLCASRPVLLAVPPENLASRIVSKSGAGLSAPADDPVAFAEAASRFFEEPVLRETCGRRARSYAETTFDIERITDRFEQVLRPDV
jgi:glycosyltransferase involved in cell wall biosynthesis